jgi:hypothetical protein
LHQVGVDPDGKPVYSGTKVQYGNCSGFLETYYTSSADYYQQFHTDPRSPVTLLDMSTPMGAKALDEQAS